MEVNILDEFARDIEKNCDLTPEQSLDLVEFLMTNDYVDYATLKEIYD